MLASRVRPAVLEVVPAAGEATGLAAAAAPGWLAIGELAVTGLPATDEPAGLAAVTGVDVGDAVDEPEQATRVVPAMIPNIGIRALEGFKAKLRNL